MWLEIDENNKIIGIHNLRCDTPNQWVDFNGKAELGDQWLDGKILTEEKPAESQDIFRKKRINKYICSYYPLWKQMNILREGVSEKIDKMGKFIDACKKLAKDPNSNLDALVSIKP